MRVNHIVFEDKSSLTASSESQENFSSDNADSVYYPTSFNSTPKRPKLEIDSSITTSLDRNFGRTSL